MNSLLDEKNKRLFEFIEPSKKDKILVIGTGICPKIETPLFSIFGCENITSGDIDYNNIKRAKEQLPKLNFIYLDAQKPFPLEDKSFDKVIFTEVLEHLPDENIVLSEIRRVLKPSGFLIITVPKIRWFNIFSPITWVQHKREYTEESLTEILGKNGFKIDKMFVCGSFYDLLNLWVHLVYKHIFRKLHPELFFKKKVDRYYRKGFRGKGIDIIAKASP